MQLAFQVFAFKLPIPLPKPKDADADVSAVKGPKPEVGESVLELLCSRQRGEMPRKPSHRPWRGPTGRVEPREDGCWGIFTGNELAGSGGWVDECLIAGRKINQEMLPGRCV